MAGGFFGGLSEGITDVRQQGIQQQQVDQQGQYQRGMLQVQQQQQQHAQQRELFARADKDVSNLMDTASKTIEQLKLAGKDNAEIAKAIQPIVQQAKKLRQSAGGDPAMIDAQIATTLAQPSYNPPSASPGSAAAPPAAASPPPTAGGAPPGGPSAASPSDIPAQPTGAGPQPPGQNITDQNVVKVEPQQNEVDKWTTALATLPSYAPASMRDAFKARLENAIKTSTPDATVHFAKTDAGEIPLVIKKTGSNVTITDTNGNPYVAPAQSLQTLALDDPLLKGVSQDQLSKVGTVSEDGVKVTGHMKIALAIMSGMQPPTTTGLYKEAGKVKEDLASMGVDLSQKQLQWQAAVKQVASLNGPQQTRYAGLAIRTDRSIDEVVRLSQEMKNGGIPLLNAAKLKTYINTEGNSPKGILASKYLVAVGAVKEEFANLANGGYAPTDPAWKLAETLINGNYGTQQLEGSLREAQTIIRYGLHSIPNWQTLGPTSKNQYTGNPGSTSPDTGGGAGHSESAKPSVPAPPAGFVVMSP